MAKMTRERMVKERRALKLEKKQAARMAKEADATLPANVDGQNDEVGDPAASSEVPAERAQASRDLPAS
jgi:hypothetical protein